MAFEKSYGSVAGVATAGFIRLDSSKSDVKTRNASAAATVVGLAMDHIVNHVRSENKTSNLIEIPVRTVDS